MAAVPRIIEIVQDDISILFPIGSHYPTTGTIKDENENPLVRKIGFFTESEIQNMKDPVMPYDPKNFNSVFYSEADGSFKKQINRAKFTLVVFGEDGENNQIRKDITIP